MIFITARVHAAEVTGSLEIEAILNHLIGNSKEAFKLRSMYIFKIVAMLNLEGVICGNYRCGLLGSDLNRRWDSPNEYLHPQIFFLKNYMQKITIENKPIFAFCDLHSHSRKSGAFIYGCHKAANGSFCTWTKVRLLPRIYAKLTPMFYYRNSRFGVKDDKQRTARVVVWKEFGVTNSFTLESSIYGYPRGDEILPFTIDNYHSIGKFLLTSFLEYYYVVKSLEREMIITKGWLKPSRLVEEIGRAHV